MSSFFLVSGNDEFAIKARAKEHIINLCGEDFEANGDLEIIRGDDDNLSCSETVGRFIGSVNTPPFLSTQKIVWLRNFNQFEVLTTSSAKDNVSALAQMVALFKQTIPDDVAIVINGTGLDQRTALAKALKGVDGVVADFYKKADLADKDYTKNQAEKIVALAKKFKKQVEPDAIEYLSIAVGSDYGRMQCEIDKIATFLGEDRMITLEVCRNICSRTPEALGWEFARALTDGDRTAALQIADTSLREMKNSRSSSGELTLIYQAVRGFKDILDTRLAMLELGINDVGRNYFYNAPENLKSDFPNNMLLKVHPFRAYKLVESALRFPERKIATAYKALLEANRRMVSGGGDSRIILEDLIIKVTTK